MSDIASPLVPYDVDLTAFAYMPLDVRRLRDSRIAATASGDEFMAAVLLWCASWHQKPAASLPDDDVELANLAGFGRVIKEWRKVRAKALHGWVKCSDGKFYHPVIAEKAMEAWAEKLEYAWMKECDRIRKENKRREANGETAIGFPPKPSRNSVGQPPETEKLPAEMPDASVGNPTENALKGSKGNVREGNKERDDPPSSQVAAREKPPMVTPDQISVIRVFDAAIVKHWGAAQARPNPAATDSVTAQSYLEAGADLDLLAFVFDAQCQKLAHGQKRPPGTLKYFERTVLDVIAEGKRPPLKAQAAGGTDEGRYFGPDGQWRKRVESFLDSGFWRDAWGSKPGCPGCAVPPHVLAEFAAAIAAKRAAE